MAGATGVANLAITITGIDQISSVLETISAQVKELGGVVDASSEEIGTAFKSVDENAAMLGDSFKAAATEASGAIEGLAANTEKSSLAMDESAKSTDEAAASTSKMGMGATLAGAALVAGFALAVKSAADFQQKLQQLVDTAGESQKNLASVGAGMLSISSATGESLSQLSTGMYTIESAGFHGAAGLDVLKASTQGAKEEGADLKTVADAVSTALTDYHLPASDAATVTSQLLTAVGQGKTTMQDFSGALHSITPLAASMHISLADVTGTLAEMTDHGMSADQASQNLAETLRTLISPTQSQVAELAQLGLTANDLSSDLSSKGLQGTLESLSQSILTKMGPSGKVLLDSFNTSKQAAANLSEAISNAPPAVAKLAQAMVSGTMSYTDYHTAIKDLPANQYQLATSFGTLYNQANGFTNSLKNGSVQSQSYTQALKAATGNATSLSTALLVTGENSAGAQLNIKKVSEATADAKGNVQNWTSYQQGLNAQLDDLKATVVAAATSVGEALLPALTAITKIIIDGVAWVAKIAEKFKDLTAGGLILFAVIGGGILTLLGIAKAITAVQKSVEAVQEAWKTVGKVITDGWDFAKTIAGFIKTGVVGVANAVSTGVAWVASAVASAAAWVAANAVMLAGIGLLIVVVAAVVYEIIKHWNDIKQWFSDFIGWLKTHWQDVVLILLGPIGLVILAWKLFHTQITDLFKDALAIIESVWNGIVGFFSALWGALIAVVKTIFHVYVDIFKAEYDGVMAVWNGIVAFFNALWAGLKAVVNTLRNFIVSIFRDEWNGIVSVWNGVTGFFASVWNGIKSGLGVIKGIFTAPFKDAFDGIAELWNDTAGKLSFKLPSWVPGIGGKGFDMPKIPMLASGTQNFIGGAAIVGEQGPELVLMPSGSQVLPASTTAAMMNAQGSNSVNTTATQSGNGLTLNVNVGTYAGQPGELNQIAQTIWQQIQVIARQHGMAGNLPNIGVRPI